MTEKKTRAPLVWPPDGEVMHKAGRYWPLCGRLRGSPVKGSKIRLASWYASDRWDAVTCPACLAKRPPPKARKRGKGKS